MSQQQSRILFTTMGMWNMGNIPTGNITVYKPRSMGNTGNVVIHKLDISAERFEALAEVFKSTELAAGIPALENDASEDKRYKRLRIAKRDPSCLRDSKFTEVILQNLSTRLVGHITTDYQDPRTMRLNGRLNHYIRNNNHD